jgi:hypothetical protein
MGLVPRLAFVSSFPTIPVSDADGLVSFGVFLRDHGLTSPVWFWEQFNPGLPLLLCALFRIFPHADPGAVARLATAVFCGFLPVVPFVIWRGIYPLWVRSLAGAALGLWPGQVAFSGVVLQDNWVILPSLALGALAVRSLLADEPPRLVTAGLLYAAGTAFRQEMLVVLLPLFLTAIGANFRMPWRRAAAAGLAAGLPLLALAAYRDAATGHFALTTPHGGVTTLGSYIPGAGADGWTHPAAFIASVRPELLRDREAYFSQSGRLALQEALRRPAFHLARIVASVGSAAVTGEATILPASLGAPEVLPAALHERGAALANALDEPFRWETAAILGLFLAAVVIGVRQRNRAILILASAVLLKYAFHAVTVVFGRFFFVSTAWEILAIALAAYEIRNMAPPGRLRLLTQAFLFGGIAVAGLLLFVPRLKAVVRRLDTDPQRTYRFQLESPDHTAALACVIDRGLLQGLDWNRYALLRTRLTDPAPGDEAVAVCEVTGRGEPKPMVLQVLDSYAPGGLPGRMAQAVAVDGAEVWSHDIAQIAWSGWANIPLGEVGLGTKRKVEIVVKALHPENYMGWGIAAQTRFQLAAASPALNLATGKNAAQSSNYPSTSGAGAAVDGNTDGRYSQGSLTTTNRDENAWWEVDLGASVPIGAITIWNRTDCCSERLEDYWVFVSDTPFRSSDTPATLKSRAGTWSTHQTAAPQPSIRLTAPTVGRYIRVQLNGANYLSLAEVQVFAK